jgi:hypothetical protein
MASRFSVMISSIQIRAHSAQVFVSPHFHRNSSIWAENSRRYTCAFLHETMSSGGRHNQEHGMRKSVRSKFFNQSKGFGFITPDEGEKTFLSIFPQLNGPACRC